MPWEPGPCRSPQQPQLIDNAAAGPPQHAEAAAAAAAAHEADTDYRDSIDGDHDGAIGAAAAPAATAAANQLPLLQQQQQTNWSLPPWTCRPFRRPHRLHLP